MAETTEWGALRAVFLDLDDTLFDRRRAQLQAFPLLMARFPESLGALNRDQALAAFLASDDLAMQEHEAGLPLAGVRLRRFELLVELLDLDRELAAPLCATYVREYPRLDAAVDGARELVQILAAHYRLGVISNGLPDVQYAKLEGLGIRPWLSCVVLSGEVDVAKPDPRVFTLALDKVGAPAAQALHVGDSFASDVAGALGAGLSACWYNPGAHPAPAGGPSPTFAIRTLAELPVRLGL